MGFTRFDQSQDEGSAGELAEINMIPLIDVMLVLLIVFMVAAPLSISGIKVNLPASQAKGSAVEEARIILTINSKGSYFINKSEISPKQLAHKIKAIFEFKERKELYIRADKGVAYGRVVDAMSAAKMAGVHKMAMLTTQKPRGQSRASRR